MESMERALEAHLKHLGDKLENTVAAWRTEDTAKRGEIEQALRSLEDEIGSVKERLVEARSFSLPGVEAAKNGERCSPA